MSSNGAKKPNKTNRPPDGKLSLSTVALAVGILLIVVGVWQLADQLLGAWFDEIMQVIKTVLSIVGPLLIIAGGVALMHVARKGNLSMPTDRKLYRSVRNKKISGVCGGIGEYLNADAAVVRVITIVLAILCWYVIVPLYILFWIIIEPDTRNYNTWV